MPEPRSTPLWKRPPVRLALKVALTLIALGLAALSLRGVPLDGLVARLGAFPRWALVLALVATVVEAGLHAARLWIVFPRHERPGYGAVARAYAFGQLANAFLPGRSGDVLKAALLSRAPGEARRPSLVDATGALVVDKALDLVTFGGLALIAARELLAGAIGGALRASWAVVPAIALVVLGGVILRRVRPHAFAKAFAGVRAVRGTAGRLLGPGRLGAGIVLGTVGWVIELGAMVALGEGLGLHLSALQILRGLVVLNLGIAVPVSVANVGTYEAATMVGLMPFGVPAADAIALGALHHVVALASALLSAGMVWAWDRVAERRAAPAAAPATATTALLLPAAAA